MSIDHFAEVPGLVHPAGYSHTVAGAGRTVYVAGQLPIQSDGSTVPEDDHAAQADQVMENIALALAAAGVSVRQVVKFTVFVTDFALLPHFKRARERHLGETGPFPASTAVQVSALARPGCLIEVEAVAVG
jgi:enamine deaminase RidA (YjgF/YER057c/UK114 family)